jgi:hypothetical protein
VTRRDYIRIAAALNRVRPTGGNNDRNVDSFPQWARTVEAIADALAEDNPRFDRYRFWDAADRV